MDPIIRLQNVAKRYRSAYGVHPVLDNLDMDVSRGEFLAIMGVSGSGKTTLLNLIGGLDRPDQGSIRVAGTRLDELSAPALTRWRAGHVGFIFQANHLMPMLTAAANVELPLLLTRLSRKERREKVAATLLRVGLADRAGNYPAQLSGGQQQRVGIARSLVAGAPILLCDEPTADLDRLTADSILRLLRELSLEGHTVVMVTHNPLAAAAADRQIELAAA